MTVLIPAERRRRIFEALRSQGTVRVSDLSDLLRVSEITIRRDLELLETEGLLERTHGGAIYNQHIRLEPMYSEKHRAHIQEKRQIGAAAVDLVADGSTIFINSGSTTLQVIAHLAGKKDVKVITSNMGAFLEAPENDLELMLTGGVYRPQSHSLVGPLAMLSLQQVFADQCFIGVDGISLKYGVTTPNVQEAEVARTMIARTHGQVVVVADHSKFGVVADFVSSPLEQITTLVTDAGVHPEHIQNLQEAGVQVIVAGGHRPPNPHEQGL